MRKATLFSAAAMLAVTAIPTAVAQDAAVEAAADAAEAAEDAVRADAVPEAPPVLSAKDQEMLDKLLEIFGGANDEPIDPARLKLAESAMEKLLPDGIMGKMTDQLIDQLVPPLLATEKGLSDTEIWLVTGAEGLTIDDEKREAITAIIDPQYDERNEQIVALIKPLLGDMLKAVELPMRQGMARAYARRFDVSELSEMVRFFETPTGTRFAEESYLVQIDPEVMGAMIKALPDLLTQLQTQGPEWEAEFKDLPEKRQLSDLNDREMKKLAGLLDVEVSKLEEWRDVSEEAVEGAEAAAAEAAESVEWYDEDNWSKEYQEKYVAAKARADGILEDYLKASNEADEIADAAAADAKRRLNGESDD